MMMMDAPPDSQHAEARFLQVASRPKEWLLTGLHVKTPSQHFLNEMQDATWIHEQGCLYRHDGTGFFFGPVGQPLSYLSSLVMPKENGKSNIMMASAMDLVSLKPGQIRWGQQAGLFFEPPNAAMARWAEWVVLTHGSRTHKGAVTGWSSVYSPERTARGSDALKVIQEIPKSQNRLSPDVIQIGENFESESGHSIDVVSLYPEGYPFYAKKITATGARAGIKLDFVITANNLPSCIARVKEAVDNGFTFLKMGYHQTPNFLRSLAGGEKNSFECARENMRELRKAAGEETYILFCEWFTDRATLGYIDASRTSPVTTRNGVRDVMHYVLMSYHLNGRWFAVDNDCYYLATELKDVSPVVGGWPLARTWISMVGLSCGNAITSDNWNEEKYHPYWRNVEVMTPPAKEKTEVIDIGRTKAWSKLVGQVRRDWGQSTVALLWNPSDQEQVLTFDFAKAGLDPQQRYAVWSFWENRYLGLAQQFWRTPQLASSASQHLCFTPIPHAARPTLIGSNLHIYCGAAEIKMMRSSRSSINIELTDAGARAGDLFIYSRFPVIMQSATGLTVTAVDQAGENVWRIRLRDRQRGALQQIDLRIQLPLTRQWWFWIMIVLLFSSTIIAVWRYVSWLKLHQQHSLAIERTRIARDLHDDLGASLARIGLLTDLAEQSMTDPALAKQQLGKIYQTAHDLTRQLDEVVWTVDPRHDCLESFARHLHGYAQEYLSAAKIRCQFSTIDHMPEIPIASPVRHELLMMIKEVLHNVVSHSQANTVVIDLQVTPKHLSLEIRDNGIGMPADSQRSQGNGVDNIHARARRLAAQVRYTANPQTQGTIWHCMIPLIALSSPTTGPSQKKT
jgi:signal transduction histidine kinase